MSAIVTVGPKYQIVIPKEVRERLRLEPGQKVRVEARNGLAVVLPQPARYSDHAMGLGEGLWDGVDAEGYVREERRGWGGRPNGSDE